MLNNSFDYVPRIDVRYANGISSQLAITILNHSPNYLYDYMINNVNERNKVLYLDKNSALDVISIDSYLLSGGIYNIRVIA